ncbi:MAG: DUF1028 domain-containing protein [Saprospiraceae bacterium]|nr:DUF1028 domain-containing protein [Saprospiraceae bacterium]
MRVFAIAFFAFVFGAFAMAQDTFSIVAVDSLTGEVGSAGASCISADNLELYFPDDDPDFLGDLLPGIGAINTQSFYNATNQELANQERAAGRTPQEVIDWMAANDAENDSSQRQYGVAALINGQPMAAGFTGANCFDFKNHVTGPNYSIQGNILLGQEILDSMEARFLAAEASGKCLSERLMAAMQGAKVPGADTRCLNNGTSAMFAFIKLAKPDDDPADPTLRLFVSYNPLGIEPIDSLQALFDLAAPCFVSFTKEKSNDFQFQISPNPTSGMFGFQFAGAMPVGLRMEVFDSSGRCVFQRPSVSPGEQFSLENPGVYMVKLMAADGKTGWNRIVVRGE